MKYAWKRGVKGVSPQIAGEIIDGITKKNGGSVTPKDIVNEARDIGSPLHSAFLWDDTLAAEAYRETQAQYILRSIVVIEQEDTETPLIVRAFVSLEDGESYQTMRAVMEDPNSRATLLRNALSELQAWRKKYGELQELASIYAAMDQISATG